MTTRRLLALAAALTSATVAATMASAVPATARPVSDRSVSARCLDRGPIPVHALRAASRSGCSLVGRMVTDGRVSVMVPPAGMSVAGDGLSRHGDVQGLTVTNTGRTVKAVHRSHGVGGQYLAPLSSTTSTTTTSTTSTSTLGKISGRAGSPAACKDRTYHLEHHRWAGKLRYRVNLNRMPKRFGAKTVIRQIKVANGNMRKGRNNCGKPHLRTPHSHYGGRTKARPNIRSGGPTCGQGNRSNIVAFGNLPGGLLGWTCYWWVNPSGRLVGADMLLDNGKDMTTHLPKKCQNQWDFEGTVTHEWGHAYGMAHTGSGHQNLTMQHLLAPCSKYARTLGLGDWLGMNKMYGHR